AESICHILCFIGRSGAEIADGWQLSCLLRPRRDRPRRRRAADQRDELAAPHSITSSARRRRAVGTSKPMALAVLRLRIVSNFVGCSTGRSAALAPFAILSTYSAARRNISDKLAP